MSMDEDIIHCVDCKYWDFDEINKGYCHRYPPENHYWPYTFSDGWCGEGSVKRDTQKELK